MRRSAPRQLASRIQRGAHISGEPFARADQPVQKVTWRDVKRLGRLGVRKTPERDEQHDFAQF